MTWQDIKLIVNIADDYLSELVDEIEEKGNGKADISEESYYREVLKRYEDTKSR